MGAGNLFAGLVKGFGGTMERGYARKREQDYAMEQSQRQLALSALINDPNLPGHAKRLGLKNLGMPDELAAALVPDIMVESGQYMAEEAPPSVATPKIQGQPVVPPMPQGPALQQQVPVDNNAPLPPGRSQPQDQRVGGMAGAMAPMPRNPLVDHPAILPPTGGSPAIEGPAPVTSRYTGGIGNQIDELDQRIAGIQQSLRHGAPMMKSSLGMSQQQMQEARQQRLRDSELERQWGMHQLESALSQKTALQNFGIESQAREQSQLAMISAEFQARVKAIGDARGTPLNPMEINQLAGIKLGPAEEEIQTEANLYRKASDPNAPFPERQAAKNQLEALQTARLGQKANIQNTLSEIAKRNREGSQTDPQDAAKAAQMKSMMVFGPQQRDEYVKAKALEIEQQLTSELNLAQQSGTIQALDPEMMHELQLLKANPGAIKSSAIRMAQKEADKFREAMSGTFFTYAMQGKEPIMLREVLETAKRAGAENSDAANQVWTAVKNAYAAGQIIVLQDDLTPWPNPGGEVAKPNARIPRRARK